MTGKEQLVASLRTHAENEAALAQQSVLKVYEIQVKVQETFDEITRWLNGVDGVKVEQVEGSQQPFMATVFNPKYLKISLAKRLVQFNPQISDSGLYFTVVGLADRDLQMDTDYTLSDQGQPIVTISEDTFCRQLANLVQRTL